MGQELAAELRSKKGFLGRDGLPIFLAAYWYVERNDPVKVRN